MEQAVQRRFIRVNELASTPGKPGMLPVSAPTIWRWVKAKQFPAPVQLGPGVTAFDLQKVEAFLQARAAAATDERSRPAKRSKFDAANADRLVPPELQK